jgi:NTE family protein
LWSADGELPRDLSEANVRQKEIQFFSRTRAATDQFKYAQTLSRAFRRILPELPEELRNTPEVEMLAKESDETVYNVVHLIYHSKSHEGISKDYEFSRRTMEEHWTSGYDDAVRTLDHPEVFERPTNMEGVHVFDFAKRLRELRAPHDHFRKSLFARARGRLLGAPPAAPALRPVAGVELAGRLARPGDAKND